MVQRHLLLHEPAPARVIAENLQIAQKHTNVALSRLVARGNAFVVEERRYSWSTRPLQVFGGQPRSDADQLQSALAAWAQR
jgi:hypothetical protein